jgi:glycosyltransferase involved in cell wall biosynthesis
MWCASFRTALPHAVIYVYDNNSRDDTVARARDAGALVRRERRQGKGHVVRRMFADVEADIYMLADGDGTYDAASAPAMVAKLVGEQLDMVVGSRLTTYEGEAFRRGHRPASGTPRSKKRSPNPARLKTRCWVSAWSTCRATSISTKKP